MSLGSTNSVVKWTDTGSVNRRGDTCEGHSFQSTVAVVHRCILGRGGKCMSLGSRTRPSLSRNLLVSARCLALTVETIPRLALLRICDSSFTCEDHNTYRVHPWSSVPLRRAHPGPGPHS